MGIGGSELLAILGVVHLALFLIAGWKPTLRKSLVCLWVSWVMIVSFAVWVFSMIPEPQTEIAQIESPLTEQLALRADRMRKILGVGNVECQDRLRLFQQQLEPLPGEPTFANENVPNGKVNSIE